MRKHIDLTLTPELIAHLKHFAAEDGTNLTAFVRGIVVRYIRERLAREVKS